MNCLTSLSSPALGTQQANPFELYMPQTVDLIGKKKVIVEAALVRDRLGN